MLKFLLSFSLFSFIVIVPYYSYSYTIHKVTNEIQVILDRKLYNDLFSDKVKGTITDNSSINFFIKELNQKINIKESESIFQLIKLTEVKIMDFGFSSDKLIDIYVVKNVEPRKFSLSVEYKINIVTMFVLFLIFSLFLLYSRQINKSC